MAERTARAGEPGQDTTVTRRYRDLMTGFPSGVAVVTAIDAAGDPQGMTCTSLASVTLVPPTLLVSLRHGSATLSAVEARRAFAVNLLGCGAREVAALFAAPVPDRFGRVRWEPSPQGLPWLVDEALGRADCVTVGGVDVGDHQVVFGEVVRVSLRGGNPLLYGMRRFGAWGTEGCPGCHRAQVC
jgi:flavin reductase (DIM6/NTAB) family NADH-FMN oxidoreductase RutF